MSKIFIDTDIILDVFTQREPHYDPAAGLFSLIDKGIYQAYSSVIIINNLFYILRKLKGLKKTNNIIEKLLTLISVLPVDEKIIHRALHSEFKDFEDAIQYYTATEHAINVIITRNIKDYKPAKIQVLSAQDFLNIHFNSNKQ